MKAFRISLLVLVAVSLAACGSDSIAGPQADSVTAEGSTADRGKGFAGTG